MINCLSFYELIYILAEFIMKMKGFYGMNKSDLPSQAGQKRQGAEINCFSCQHFYITHDLGFSYGCRSAGFKSWLLPSIEVCMKSGMDCLMFDMKDKTR